MDENPLMQEESHHAIAFVSDPLGSKPSGSSDGFEPSPKLRARIEKLEHWRIDPSFIEVNSDRVSHGGHATVSRGTMDPNHVYMQGLERGVPGKNIAIGGSLRNRRAPIRWFEDEKDVAVKKMRIADDTDFERVLGLTIREAEFLAMLDHKNIVKLEGFVEDASKGIIWLVFPWAGHGNLKDFIAREKWDIPERISLISDVAKGLEYLHTENPPICHGDLKSLNVLIYGDLDDQIRRETFYARITDFGSARRSPQRDPNTQMEMRTQLPSAQPLRAAFDAHTNTITLTGNNYTLRWAAPELLLEDQLSLWSDIWALGWIAYEVMTESLPFEDAASEMAVIERVLEGKLPPLTDNTSLLIIHELCSLMNMCWEAQPVERPTANSCRRSIEKMPMFAPEMKDDERILDCHHLCHLGQMYQSRGEHARAFTHFVDALDHETKSLEFDEQIQVLRDLAQLARLKEEYSKTISVYDVIWEMYERGDRRTDWSSLGEAFYDLAELHRLRKESEETKELYNESQYVQEQQRVAEALCAMAKKLRLRKTHHDAIRLNSYALNISTDLGDEKGRAKSLWGIAEAHRGGYEYEEAIPLYSKLLEIFAHLGDKKGRADALWGLADIHRRRSNYEEAISLFFEVSQIRGGLGDRKGRADALWGLAEAHRSRSEYQKAIPLYSEALKIRTGLGDKKGSASALWGLVDVHRCRGEYEKTISLYSKLLKIFTHLGDNKGKVSALWGLAEVHRRQRQYEEAITFYSGLMEICTDLGDRAGRASALRGLAEVHRLRTEYEEAIPLYYKALRISTEIDDRKGKAAALLGLADIDHDPGYDGENLDQQLANILEQSRTSADPSSDDEWLVRLQIRVSNWAGRILGTFASDSTKAGGPSGKNSGLNSVP